MSYIPALVTTKVDALVSTVVDSQPISRLLSLLLWDATGKLLPSSFSDARVASIDLEGEDDARTNTIPLGYLPLKYARTVQNLWPQTDDSDHPTTQTIDVIDGHEYQLQIGPSVSGTVSCSGAFSGLLLSNSSSIKSWNDALPKVASGTSVTITVSSSNITNIQLEDVTGRQNKAPSEYQTANATHDGFAIYNRDNGNVVDSAGYVSYELGALLSRVNDTLFNIGEGYGDSLTWMNVGAALDGLLGVTHTRYGYGGQTIATIASNMTALCPQDVGVDYVVLQFTVANNMMYGADTAATIVSHMQTMVDHAVSLGMSYVIVDCPPWGGYGTWTPTWQERTEETNALLLDTFGDVVVQTTAILQDPENPYNLLPAYTTDGIHLTNLGAYVLDRDGIAPKMSKFISPVLQYVAGTTDTALAYTALADVFNQAEGTLLITGWVPAYNYDTPTGDENIVSLSGSAASLLYSMYSIPGSLAMTDGTNVASIAGVNWVAGKEYNIALRWTNTEMQLGVRCVTDKAFYSWSDIAVYDGEFTVSSGEIELFKGSNFDQAIKDIIGYNKDRGIAWIEAQDNPNVAPVIDDDQTAYEVNSDAEIGTVLHTFTATDANTGDTKTWSIVSGNTNGDLGIDSATGALSTVNALDYETTPTYSPVIRVTDSQGLYDEITCVITVNNVLARDFVALTGASWISFDTWTGGTGGSITIDVEPFVDGTGLPTGSPAVTNNKYQTIVIPFTGSLTEIGRNGVDYFQGTIANIYLTSGDGSDDRIYYINSGALDGQTEADANGSANAATFHGVSALQWQSFTFDEISTWTTESMITVDYSQSTGSWVKRGNNLLEVDDGGIKITYVDDAGGAYWYISDSHGDLSQDMFLGAKYTHDFQARQVAGGNAKPAYTTPLSYPFSPPGENYSDFSHTYVCSNTEWRSMTFQGFSAGEAMWLRNHVYRRVMEVI